ncbi:ATP-binding protein [Neobacillus sp. YIM B06451]|uniref:ATP-binding protein n=1 Tax=Neobacillus sp. YIM B06451 TaxID=3070994 RepID=UPI00292E1582|nr:ATP-binding protein [Neobacillus sp. YIM B06451]
MKIVGRITMVILSLGLLLFDKFYYGENFFRLHTLFFIVMAFVVGWQYDRLSYYVKKTQESEDSYKRLIESLPEAVIIHRGYQVLYVNEAAVKMMRAENKGQLIGLNIFEYTDSQYIDRVKERINLAEQEQRPLSIMEYKVKRLDGEPFFFEASSMAITYGGKDCHLTLGKDITNRKKETDRLLQKSEKLALLGQMAAGIAHEIRNPLTSIKGFIQLFKAENDKKEYYDIVLTELDRINSIVSEFLLLAKPTAAVFREGNLVQILRDVVTLINTQTALNNVQITTAVGPNIPPIICEENQLKQVFINLLKNSIEAMPEGGNIYISVQKSQPEEVFVKIVDEGVGIPEERMKTIGEPFYTTKEKGTGLGLMTCFKIIESHNGKLIFSSKVGVGTSIIIVLPAMTRSHLKKEIEE